MSYLAIYFYGTKPLKFGVYFLLIVPLNLDKPHFKCQKPQVAVI